jgi:hypothetical protein
MSQRVGDHAHQRNEQPETAHSKRPAERLDPPTEVDGSWTVDNVHRRTPTGVRGVTTPDQPPTLHPEAAAALLTLLRRVNDKRTINPTQE